MSLRDVFKSKETKHKEAEQQAEQELQRLFNNPRHLYTLCSCLTPEDQMKFFRQCTDIKNGKMKLDPSNLSIEASDLLKRVQACEGASKSNNDRLEGLAKMRERVDALLKESFTDTNSRNIYFEDFRTFKQQQSFHQGLSKTESGLAWVVLLEGVMTGRIKDISQVQKLSVNALSDRLPKLKKAGLIVDDTQQARAAQKQNQGR